LYEHGIPLTVFLLLSLALSWPTVRNFTTRIVSGGGDARHHLWVMWHTKEAVLGRQPLFYAPLLYYPRGISMLLHSVGPVVGLLALPFWPLGPEAAYNGAILVGFWLSGYAMYLLARGLDLERGVALFAGILLMSSEMLLAGLRGHVSKTVVFPLPLTLLATHYALDTRRSHRWAVGTALSLLLTLLHSGWQFVLAALAVAFFFFLAWFANRRDRYALLRRAALFAVSALLVLGPLLAATLMAASQPGIVVDKRLESFNNHPDLIEFLLPPRSGRLLGQRTTQYEISLGVRPSIETTVAPTRTAIFLCLVALMSGSKPARRWMVLSLLCVILALGPTLKMFGRDHFTGYNLPIVLPYAFLTMLPGLAFMRAPGRFMLLGFVGFGIGAGFGLTQLIRESPRWRHPITALAIVLILLESWPHPWGQETLRPIPRFYEQIARDEAIYGVFDLPIKPAPSAWDVGYSSHYQLYQMTHRKGIASGYLSRVYGTHPLFPCLFSTKPVQPDGSENSDLANCYLNAQRSLAEHGYRYVVWHKPQSSYRDYRPGSWGEEQAKQLIETAFGQATPLVDDELVRVYAVEGYTPSEVGDPHEAYLPAAPRAGERRSADLMATMCLPVSRLRDSARQ
jgi:hypothetical protein